MTLHPEIPKIKTVCFKSKGEFVDIIYSVNSEYTLHVIYEGKIIVLYLKVLRVFYGCLSSAMLWYTFYLKILEGMVFELNQYDLCVANKTINGKHYTIIVYVDENKISHDDLVVVDDIMK